MGGGVFYGFLYNCFCNCLKMKVQNVLEINDYEYLLLYWIFFIINFN